MGTIIFRVRLNRKLKNFTAQFRGRSTLNRSCAARLNREARSLSGSVWRARQAQRQVALTDGIEKVRNFTAQLEGAARLTAGCALPSFVHFLYRRDAIGRAPSLTPFP